MKIRNLVLLCGFVFCLLIVMFCQTDEKEIQRTQTLQRYSIHVSDDARDLFEDQARANLIDRIDTFKSDVEGSFLPGQDQDPSAEIGDLLEDQNVILEDTTRNFRRIKRGAHFFRLFREAKIEKAREEEVTKDKIGLYIDIKHVTVDTIDEERVDDEGYTLNLIARVIFKYHVRLRDNPLSKNQGGGGSGEFGHRDICTWF